MTLRQSLITIQILTFAGVTQILFAVNVRAQSMDSSVGTFTEFDVPGALDTFPVSINPAGTITGSYLDANFIDHGFVRAASGAITTFDIPSGNAYGTSPASISQTGAIRETILTQTS
jgi:hypothetical protein